MNNSHPNIVVSCEPITPALLEDVRHLYADEPYKAAIWQWQFKPRFGRTPVCVVARDGDRIIGFNGTMPIQLATDDGDVLQAIWSCDFIVDTAYRGHGVGSAIKNTLFSTVTEPIMSLGISDSAYPLLLKKGGQAPVSLSVFHRVKSASTLKSQLFRWYSVARALPNYWAIKSAVLHSQVEELAHLPEKNVIDFLWDLQMRSHSGTQIVRDHEYLSWRYADYPLPDRLENPAGATYRFLSVSTKGASVSGLVVFRIGAASTLEVVDYIGDLSSAENVYAICHYLNRLFPDIAHISWNSSAPDIIRALHQCGFIRKSYSSRFVVFSNKRCLRWNLAAGDSDGDFLRDAKEHFGRAKISALEEQQCDASVSSIPTGRLISRISGQYAFYMVETQEGFYKLRSDWELLHANSSANALFMAWGWQYSWWEIWGKKLGYQLAIVTIYFEGKLIGIVPLYQYRRRMLKYFQFIGNAWGLKQTVRSEYISPLFYSGKEQQLSADFEIFFKGLGANTALIMPDSDQDYFPGLPHVVLRQDVGYRISTGVPFDGYVRGLGRLTRLKAFGRRRQLLDEGAKLQLDVCESGSEKLDYFFSSLNSFHLLRWGKPCFNREAVSFHKKVLMNHPGIKPSLSSLLIDSKLVSLSYNICADSVMYNLQSGYLEDYDKKVSLGTLHMGWEIEKSFTESSIEYFDFLAGYGKVEDYKRHYRGESVEFLTRKYFSSSFFFVANAIFIWCRLKLKSLTLKFRSH